MNIYIYIYIYIYLSIVPKSQCCIFIEPVVNFDTAVI